MAAAGRRILTTRQSAPPSNHASPLYPCVTESERARARGVRSTHQADEGREPGEPPDGALYLPDLPSRRRARPEPARLLPLRRRRSAARGSLVLHLRFGVPLPPNPHHRCFVWPTQRGQTEGNMEAFLTPKAAAGESGYRGGWGSSKTPGLDPARLFATRVFLRIDSADALLQGRARRSPDSGRAWLFSSEP